MTDQEEIKMNGWTFEETVKTAENLMESERNMFKWDVLRHLRDFAELFCEELRQYREIGTVDECRTSEEKQKAKKPTEQTCEEKTLFKCYNCGYIMKIKYSDGQIFGHSPNYCEQCGQEMDWRDDDEGNNIQM